MAQLVNLELVVFRDCLATQELADLVAIQEFLVIVVFQEFLVLAEFLAIQEVA